MPNLKDWNIAHENLWYRIPLEKAPKIIREKNTSYIAFYFPSVFGEKKKWRVIHYAKVESIVQVSRKELFPMETLNSKSDLLYYRINFQAIQTLPQPFISRRGHRIVFVSTTEEKFFCGETDFNILFKSSPLEKQMENFIKKMDIEYEKEWREYVDYKKFYYLDFAIWCKDGNINIECDGDSYHMQKEEVHNDKTRNNQLESYGWSVLRFTTKHFSEDKVHIEKTIYQTVKELGGAVRFLEPEQFYLPKKSDDNQLDLF